ncbi:hypothetical protein HYZ82_02660 [Candidatus Nomurabacteria bacterium]|nr:hypothetical protein [Candidatus Nomurabacteria bacterium]
MKKIVIGTKNETKYQLYKNLFSYFNEKKIELEKISKKIVASSDLKESLNDIVANAILKAQTYARKSGFLTLADDTAIFIPALNNEPGIAVRRWGGILPKEINDAEWERFFLNKIKNLQIAEPACIKRQVIAISKPNGECKIIENNFFGKIKVPGAGIYKSGGPFSAYFFLDQCQRFESELTKDDEDILYAEFKLKVIESILELDPNFFV